MGGTRGFKPSAAGVRYKDHGVGLEFTDKERLTEFFQKTRELYPDYSLQTDQGSSAGIT